MKEKSERSGTIDIARGIAILLVVFAHTLSSGPAWNLIYQFHMPLFFVLSGMVLRAPASTQELRTAVNKRAYTCLFPFCLWGIVFMPVTPSRFLFMLYGSWQAVCYAGTTSSLWFLPTLFLACVWCEVLLFVMRELPRPRLALAGAAVLLFVAGFLLPHPPPFGYPGGFDVSLVAAGFMLLGYAARPLLRHLQNPLRGGVGCLICVWGFLAVYREPKRPVNMASEEYGDIKQFFLCAGLGILAALGAAALLDKLPGAGRLLRCLGRHTMGIFVLHRSMISNLDAIAEILVGPCRTQMLFIILQTAANVAACMGLTLLLERYLPFTLGKGSPPGRDHTA